MCVVVCRYPPYPEDLKDFMAGPHSFTPQVQDCEPKTGTPIAHRGVVPSPEAFIGVLVSLASVATTRRCNETQQALEEFVNAMAMGNQADVTWLEDLVFAMVLAIPDFALWNYLETTGSLQPSWRSHYQLRHYLEEADSLQSFWRSLWKQAGYREEPNNIHGLTYLEWLKKMAMDALYVASIQPPSQSQRREPQPEPGGPPASQHGEPTSARAGDDELASKDDTASIRMARMFPFVRLVTNQNAWSAHAAGGGSPWCVAADNWQAKPLIIRLLSELEKLETIGLYKRQKATDADRKWLRLFTWELGETDVGTRILQQAVSKCKNDEGRVLFGCMEDHIWDACTSKHANFALTECMRFLPSSFWQNIVLAGLKGHYKDACEADTGCRVIQRLIEHVAFKDLLDMREEVIDKPLILRKLIFCKFGNYVVQGCLEQDTEEEVRPQVVKELCWSGWCDEKKQSIYELAKHRIASNVLDKALTYCRPEGLAQLVESFLEDSSQLANMEQAQYGSFVFKHLQRVAQKHLNECFDECSSDSVVISALKKNTQGRATLKLSDTLTRKDPRCRTGTWFVPEHAMPYQAGLVSKAPEWWQRGPTASSADYPTLTKDAPGDVQPSSSAAKSIAKKSRRGQNKKKSKGKGNGDVLT